MRDAEMEEMESKGYTKGGQKDLRLWMETAAGGDSERGGKEVESKT